MNSKKLLMLLPAFTFLVVACGKKDDDKSPEQKAQDTVTSNQWCMVDNMTSNFQVVTRISFSGSNAQMEYLRVNDNNAPVIHKVQDSIKWEMKSGGYLASDSFSVELVEDGGRIASLKDFNQQKMIYEQVLAKNPNLAKGGATFAPSTALVIKNSNMLSADTERNLYPCSSYTSSFYAQSPVRPLIEFNLYLSQAISTYGIGGKGELARAMAFTFPVDEVKIDPASLENTQWCSWLDMDRGRLFLRTLSIGHDKFLENSHSDLFDIYDNQSKMEKALKDNASRSTVYEMKNADGRVSGQSVQTLDNKPYTLNSLYSMVQDAKGAKALIKLNAYRPENSTAIFSDIYFDCANPAPLEFSKGFKANIKTVLDLQLEQLKQ